jgi:transposase
MITLGGAQNIYLATGATDLRKSFVGLHALIRDQLKLEPLSGAIFGFCNRRKDTVKLFFYDRGRFWVCAKRLEEGTFKWPAAGTRTVRLTATDLALLLGGVDPTHSRVRRWWQPVLGADGDR